MSLRNPTGICTDGTNLYICDTTHYIVVKMPIANPTGYTLLAGSGVSDFVDGTGSNAAFRLPTGIAYDSVNNCVYVADIASYAIRKITMSGVVTTIAGNGVSSYADVDNASGVACIGYTPQLICDSINGILYMTDQGFGTVRRLELSSGNLSTITGSSESPAFGAPIGIQLMNGVLYIADSLNNTISTINPANPTAVTTIVSIPDAQPYDLFDVIPLNNIIFMLDTGGNCIWSCDITGNSLSRLAGATDRSSGFVNGSGSAVRFHAPQFFCYAGSNIYVSDTGNDSVRSMTLTGIVNNTLTGALTSTTSALWTAPAASAYVACFVRGTPILTPTGYVAVETLKRGDRIQTSDGRSVRIIPLSTQMAITTKDTAPYKIPAHCLGRNAPVSTLILSPLHAFEIRKGVWQIPRDAATTCPAIQQFGVGEPIEYFHIICPNYATDNIVIRGAVVESFGALSKQNITYVYNARLKGYTRGPIIKRLNAQ